VAAKSVTVWKISLFQPNFRRAALRSNVQLTLVRLRFIRRFHVRISSRRFIKPLGEDSTPATVKPLRVSLVEPVVYPLTYSQRGGAGYQGWKLRRCLEEPSFFAGPGLSDDLPGTIKKRCSSAPKGAPSLPSLPNRIAHNNHRQRTERRLCNCQRRISTTGSQNPANPWRGHFCRHFCLLGETQHTGQALLTTGAAGWLTLSPDKVTSASLPVADKVTHS
jgi:hypothetical protein